MDTTLYIVVEDVGVLCVVTLERHQVEHPVHCVLRTNYAHVPAIIRFCNRCLCNTEYIVNSEYNVYAMD